MSMNFAISELILIPSFEPRHKVWTVWETYSVWETKVFSLLFDLVQPALPGCDGLRRGWRPPTPPLVAPSRPNLASPFFIRFSIQKMFSIWFSIQRILEDKRLSKKRFWPARTENQQYWHPPTPPLPSSRPNLSYLFFHLILNSKIFCIIFSIQNIFCIWVSIQKFFALDF